MTDPAPIVRPATKADCRAIAELFLAASDGLAAYIWELAAEPGEALLDTGARRYAREEGVWSYTHCRVAERDGRVVGMVHAFPIPDTMPADPPPEPAPEPDPVLRPYAELEDPGSLYVAGVATVPDLRGRGIGRRLLALAIDAAGQRGLSRVSLICFEANAPALAWYRRLGFVETARRALVPHRTLKYTAGDALLLVKTLA